mgnify:CR=1 FL=1
MTYEILRQCMREAKERYQDKTLPLDVRIRSRVTYNELLIRADKEGWDVSDL